MKGLFLRAIGYVLTCVSVADAAVSGGGQTIFVNGISYYASPDPVSIISATADMLNSAKTSGVDLIPVTVMEDSSSLFTTDVFRTIVNNYTASDDVFNSGFLQGELQSIFQFQLIADLDQRFISNTLAPTQLR